MAVSGDGVGGGTWLRPVRVKGLFVGVSASSQHAAWQGGELFDIIVKHENKHLSEPEASKTIHGMETPQQCSGSFATNSGTSHFRPCQVCPSVSVTITSETFP